MLRIKANTFSRSFSRPWPSFFCRCKSTTVNFIGVPFSDGQPRKGTELGPGVLRTSGVIETLRRKGLIVSDSGDIQVTPNQRSADQETSAKAKNASSVSLINHRLSQVVSRSTKEHDVTVIMGGDHSIAVGSLYGHHSTHPGKVGVIWIDAHTDINTIDSSPSGNMHGMPLSFLIKGINDSVASPFSDWLSSSFLEPSNLAFIGVRDIDEGEKKIIASLSPKILSFSANDVHKLGSGEVIARILDRFGEKKLHVSFDVDSLDPTITPSTGTPVRDGLSLQDVLTIGEAVKKTKCLSVLDVVEVNPLIGSKDDVERTVKATEKVIVGFLP